MASRIELRCFTYIDVLQPQTAAFLATVSRGYMPLKRQAAVFFEVAPGMDVNVVTDIALKQTSCTPGMQVVERQYGCLQLQHDDQGQVRAAGDAVLGALEITAQDRLRPRVVSSQTITGITGYHAQITNRMRHGNVIDEGQTLWILECHPAGYALIAANEAEKAARVEVLEIVAFGAFGRLYLAGGEEEIAQASRAAVAALEALDGRPNEGPGAAFY
jgi:ethanolamine utilization microcompartment shell protein EutS